ncbi:gluconate 2-dehydrogenase subunit 3 family protein [Arcticibacterium luteifluviistationis]|uniref:Twin-arginine translocation pathway signal protein n=1 Tax=Arcticibacterium luteifluviistationis TaxID=1784714 RepID=A0A2Z4G8S4_9BACT|nr:gluconate 2-dehydrogenase subunit 3 family protein [Arcticibacterium luteifluviistationis]AWV97470.1 twin-arginine translocation pathway signal protein [Arcticibacterium luteifluviistationis]
MNRREALNRVAILMGGAVSAPTIMALMEGCTPKDTASTPFSLSADYQSLVAEIAEVIIPTTDTPGAKEAGVGPFIETMLRDCYSDAQAAHFTKGLKALESKSKELGGSFVSLSSEQKTEVLKGMEAAAGAEKQEAEKVKEIDAETGKVKDDGKGAEKVTPFFNIMKELTLFGYFTSEIGATQELDYVPIPGKYEGCIPLKEGQKAYAL